MFKTVKLWFPLMLFIYSLPFLLTTACNYIRSKLEDDSSLHSRTKLNIDDITSLLNFVLSNNYFIFKDNVYKQIDSCAMGTPVSLIVANSCMEEIENQAINATPVPPKIWKRYVDDSFCTIKKDAVINSPPQHP